MGGCSGLTQDARLASRLALIFSILAITFGTMIALLYILVAVSQEDEEDDSGIVLITNLLACVSFPIQAT